MKKNTIIIVKLKGQLCNQLFQYACARSLQLSDKTPSKIYYYQKKANKIDYKRYGEIEIINLLQLKESVLEKSLSYLIDGTIRILNLFGLKSLFNFIRLITDDDLDSEFLPTFKSKIIILDDYFMSPKFFLSHEEKLKLELKEKIYALATVAKNPQPNTVICHLRLGDYLSKFWIDTHYICNEEYIARAIRYLDQNYSIVNNIIFVTDDLINAESIVNKIITNLNRNLFFKIIRNSPYDDLVTIGSGSQVIISNSTFSWWAIYLFETQNRQVVIAPKIWHKKNSIAYESLYSNKWIRI